LLNPLEHDFVETDHWPTRYWQTKNIFVCRMICVDTTQDKILQLQEKKQKLASELVADDASFVKALSKSDVEYLFS